jgi:hypothetical protein
MKRNHPGRELTTIEVKELEAMSQRLHEMAKASGAEIISLAAYDWGVSTSSVHLGCYASEGATQHVWRRLGIEYVCWIADEGEATR